MAARAVEAVDLDLDAIEESEMSCFSFRFAGKAWHVKDPQDLSWVVVEQLFKARSEGDAGIFLAMDDIFKEMLFDAEVKDFMEAKADKKNGMTYRRYKALSLEVIKAVFGSPTLRSSSSSAGSPKTGRTSGASSSSRAKRSLAG